MFVALQPPSPHTSGPWVCPLLFVRCQAVLPVSLTRGRAVLCLSAASSLGCSVFPGPASLGDAILAPSAPAHEVGDNFLLTFLSLELPP